MASSHAPSRQEALRSLPAVDELLAHPALRSQASDQPRALLVEGVRQALAHAREQLLADVDPATVAVGHDELARDALARVRWLGRPGTPRVVNATGVILHTGLGRAPLARSARQALEGAAGYCLLEVDPVSGERSWREERVAERLVRLTGAEAATVVNNNAGAVLLALSAVAAGGEVVVSRGELIEIGGSFRLPEVMAQSGCILREVGATNRTHLADYRDAIGDRTRALMKAWPSNYRVTGFHAEVRAPELVELARQYDLPVLEDLGSGLLQDMAAHGFPDEPPVRRSVEAGVDLVTFSGDKMLGGPQAGLIVGRVELVQAVRKHPLFRALRPDKLALAALDATLALAEEPERALREIPVLAMMTEGIEAVEERARDLAARVREVLPADIGVTVEVSVGRLGSGALPGHDVPSRAVVLALEDPEGLHARLRVHTPPVFARVHEGRLWLDLRTVPDTAQCEEIVQALHQLLGSEASPA